MLAPQVTSHAVVPREGSTAAGAFKVSTLGVCHFVTPQVGSLDKCSGAHGIRACKPAQRCPQRRRGAIETTSRGHGTEASAARQCRVQNEELPKKARGFCFLWAPVKLPLLIAYLRRFNVAVVPPEWDSFGFAVVLRGTMLAVLIERPSSHHFGDGPRSRSRDMVEDNTLQRSCRSDTRII
ncbi:hypothetical protein BCV70DRAFT_79041 [Testicularia cyperi]|uniref:Uncharacterized protein n=1 Tax=Testicularia cyperi TaxID=1882483 RepID=A0A317XUI7_9BASI|nr:hypothetical protein BCV70DRAFT_79041 [Testicularia cyperi]